MSLRRPMGIETEFGISTPGQTRYDPMRYSGLVVLAYGRSLGEQAVGTRIWDYREESPLRDAWGFDLDRELAHESQLTEEDPTIANSVLTNGARLYVDHAHPEYSSPEVSNPRDAVVWDRAGEFVALAAVRQLASEGERVELYKNNTDGKGRSYGSHENYLLAREVPFADVVRALLPFFVARQVIAGAGRVGIGPKSERAGFQLTQRADFFERLVGLETTLKRPIVNTRDEPHADWDRYRRLHVIIGDATMADTATWLKMGTTSLVLLALERGVRLPDVELADPVVALQVVSHDPSLRTLVELADGRRMTALDLMAAYRDALAPLAEDDEATELVGEWGRLLDDLGRDPLAGADRVDWCAKLALLEGLRSRDGLGWDDARLAALDIQWGVVDPARGIAQRLRARGALRSLVSDDEVAAAVTNPPEDTRAWFRGTTLARYPGRVRSAAWDTMTFLLADGSEHKVTMPEPFAGTKAQVGDVVESCATPEELADAIGPLLLER